MYSISKSGFTNVTINGAPFALNNIAVSADEDVKVVTKSPAHYILLIDLSGSMYSIVNKMVDNISAFITTLDQEDTVSIVWFSGASSNGVVAHNMVIKDITSGMLNSLRRTYNTTCFSEGLQVCRSLTIGSANNHLIMFTDGTPVVSWSIDEELTRSRNQINAANYSGVFCVGYGNYYSEGQLTSFIESTNIGVVYHNEEINELLDTLNSIRSIAVKSGAKYLIVPTSDFPDLDIYFSIDGVGMKLHPNADQQYKFLLGTQYYGFKSGSASKSVKMVDVRNDALYTRASYEWMHGGKDTALSIVANNLRDKYLAEIMVNAFTSAERRNVAIALTYAVVDDDQRMLSGTCPPGFIPPADKYSVVDFLRDITNPDNRVLYNWKETSKVYQRTRKTSTDVTGTFNSQADAQTSEAVLITPSDRLNVSIRFTQLGYVNIEEADRLNFSLPDKYNTFKYRTHTIILNGQLNVGNLYIHVEQDSAFNEKLLTKTSSKVVGTDAAGRNIYVVNLAKMPLINRTYVENGRDVDKTLTNLLLKNSLTNQTKALKHLIDTKSTGTGTGTRPSLSAEAKNVLKTKYGIAFDGSYRPETAPLSEETEYDQYSFKSMSLNIMGLATLPSVNEAITRRDQGKTLNAAHQEIVDTISMYEESTLSHIKSVYDAKSIELSTVTDTMNFNRIGMMLSGSFYDEQVLENNANGYNYITERGTMVIKLKYDTEKVDV